jgi:hypothetical protein
VTPSASLPGVEVVCPQAASRPRDISKGSLTIVIGPIL